MMVWWFVFLIHLTSLGLTSARCSREMAQYYNKTSQSCVPCVKCKPGFGRNHHSRITVDEDGRPLSCYRCVRCPNGTYSSDEACLPCYDCSGLRRKIHAICTSQRNTLCGGCMSGFYDYYKINEEGKADVFKPCRDCKLADGYIEECREPPVSPLPHHGPAITASLVVFGLIVGVAGLIVVVCVIRYLRKPKYTPLRPEEHSDGNTSTPDATPSTADSDQLGQDTDPLTLRSDDHLSEQKSGTSPTSVQDHPYQDSVGRSVTGPATAAECSNDDANQQTGGSNDGVHITSQVTDGNDMGAKNETRRRALPLGRLKIPIYERAGIHDVLVDVSDSTQTSLAIVRHGPVSIKPTRSTNRQFPDSVELDEDGESLEVEDVDTHRMNYTSSRNLSLGHFPPHWSTNELNWEGSFISAEEGSAAASSCTDSEERYLAKSSNQSFCKPLFRRSSSYPPGSQGVRSDDSSFGNGSEASTEERVVRNTQLDMVADHLGPEHIRRLLRALRLQRADQIVEELTHGGFKGRELVYQSVLRWKQNRGCKATDRELSCALTSIGRRDISDSLK